jgi:myo-inositol-1(or 4)-monophosphatase
MSPSSAPDADWLGFCRRAAEGVRRALAAYTAGSDRDRYVGRGEGGDMTLAIDRAAEDAVFAELEALGVPLNAISEERGHVPIAGGGATHVVIDPIDGSLNAKRRVPAYSLSLAVASGRTMGDVELGYVADLAGGEEFWGRRGEGAHLDGRRLEGTTADASLELLGVESAHPRLVAAYADAIAASEAKRVRMLGSIALALCFVAAGRFDAMFSMRECRSVDAAAGQLIVLEAGGHVAFPDASDDPGTVSLGLDMRSRVAAGANRPLLDGVIAKAVATAPTPPTKA